jgi:hypothetical protein
MSADISIHVSLPPEIGYKGIVDHDVMRISKLETYQRLHLNPMIAEYR